MTTFRYLPRGKVLFAGLLLGALAACSAADDTNETDELPLTESERAAAARMKAFAPEDLSISFAGETEAQRSDLRLTDLGINAAELAFLRTKTTGNANPDEMDPKCLADPKSWRVTGLRLSPYTLAVPGQPEVWTKWAESRGQRIDTALEMRYVVSPYCRLLGDDVEVRDFALHVIFRLAPESPIAAELKKSAAYTDAQVAGDAAGSRALLESHAQALNTEEYRTFRAGVLVDWNQIAQHRTDRSKSTLDPAIGKLLGAVDKPKPFFLLESGTSADLMAAKTSPVALAVKDLTKKYAVRRNLDRLTTMMTKGGIIWSFGSFAPDASGALQPSPMRTFQAVAAGDSVDIRPVAEQPAGSIVDAKPAAGVAKAVFESQEIKRGNLKQVASQVKTKLLDLKKTNPTTMSCNGCHSIAATFLDGEFEDQYDFHLMSPNRMNVFTAAEIKSEASRLNIEFSLGGAPTSAPASGAPLPETCKIAESGFSNLRIGADESALEASLVTGTVVSLDRNLDVAGRLGVKVSGWVHQSNTTCREAKNSAECMNGATVKVDAPVKLGPSSAAGIYLRPMANEDDAPVGIVANGEPLSVSKTTASGWLKVSVSGTIAKAHCR